MHEHLLALVSSSTPILSYSSLIFHTVTFPSLAIGLSSRSTCPISHRKLVLVSIAKWNQLHRPLQRIQLCSDEANHSRNGIIHRQTDAVKPLPKPILFSNGI